MKQRDAEVDLDPRQRPLQPFGQQLGVTDERFNLGFTEIAAVSTAKAAAESLGAGDADPNPVEVDRGGLTFEHPYCRAVEPTPALARVASVVVVVAEYRDYRDRQAAQLLGEDLGLLRPAAPRQVPGEQQQGGALRKMVEG